MPYDIILGRDESDKKRFGKKGLIFLGKGYVTMGNYTSLSNSIWMDVARSHVILVAGKRGAGKSYTLGVIAEELSDLPEEESKNIASLIFDTMGIFWTMKFKNEKEKELLDEWNLKSKNLPVKVFVPFGYTKDYEERGIPFDKTFSINPYEIKIEEWVSLFNLNIISPEAVLIEKAIFNLQEKKPEFLIRDVVHEINSDTSSDDAVRNSAVSLFSAAITWGIFSDEDSHNGVKIEELIEAGRTSIIDLSCYSSIGAFNVRALVIGLLTRKLFDQRMLARKREEVTAVRHGIDYLAYSEEREMPLVWIFLDEAHEFLPRGDKTAATDALIQVLREGRQPGISLVLATQQPGQIHVDVMTQSDLVISHRITAQPDVLALNNIMQTYLLESIQRSMDELPSLKGSAIILDDNSERIYPMRVRPRFTWHGGEAPTAVKVEKRI
jgi:hypothetical protein